MRHHKFLLLTLQLAASVAAASDPPGASRDQRVVHLWKTPAQIEIDGIIDAAWARADSVQIDFQLEPYYDRAPTRRSVARVLSDNGALYCMIVSFQPREETQENTGVLDQGSGDRVSIMLDTFNDRRTAYKFAVSASGVRSDARLLDDARQHDYSWDGIWFAASMVYDWGYVVEMKIPYKSIKYERESGEWGIDFDRWSPVTKEDLYWSHYEQNEGQRVSKFGRVRFEEVRPSEAGLNLEIYPVGLTAVRYNNDGSYGVDPEAGIDVFYNPSEKLTFQLTANPDFAQIEADPFNFNISRYESYFSERRPFFTAGTEVFMPAGKQQNTGFYRPLELFYSRRIGKALPDGNVVPIWFGTKAFGRFEAWEYGGFLARTGETAYTVDGAPATEPTAYFASARVRRQIFENSSIGFLYVGKKTLADNYGVLDIDGAFRESDWQLAYQLARSDVNGKGDFGGSMGFSLFSDDMMLQIRSRAMGKNFDVSEVGFVPWKGTLEFTGVVGPLWYYQTGYLSQLLIYTGGGAYYEDADLYTDRVGLVGLNMGFRDNWGYEITFIAGKSKDAGVSYDSHELDFGSWFGISPTWNGNLFGSYQKTYNFSRGYLARYASASVEVEWKPLTVLEVGTSYGMYIEGNPEGSVEEITYNARPFFTVTPVNNLSVRVYVDNVWLRSSAHLEHVLVGFLFSYNFLPKSWIYLAINEARSRPEAPGGSGVQSSLPLRVTDRAGVFKVRYLYYF